MKTRLFDVFMETLDSVPAIGIRRVIKLEQRMLEDDLLQRRVAFDSEVHSILTFCRLLNTIDDVTTPVAAELPVTHVAYYRSIMSRLINAHELPASALNKFDSVFGSSFWRLLKGD